MSTTEAEHRAKQDEAERTQRLAAVRKRLANRTKRQYVKRLKGLRGGMIPDFIVWPTAKEGGERE